MTIDYDKLLALEFPEIEHRYSRRDTMLYALGLGFGSDPLDPDQLGFVYEARLQTVPTMGAVVAAPGFWQRDLDTSIDFAKVVHGGQHLVMHKQLPPEGVLVGQMRVLEIVDKGDGKGAIILSQRRIFDKASGDLLIVTDNTSFCRGDGGFGGPQRHLPPPVPMPEREADHVITLPTLPQAALIYRLSGDYNPLHADPETACKAGFSRPILHGLATYGFACRAILQACCQYDPSRLAEIGVRFSGAVIPGETLRFDIFEDGADIFFTANVVERDVVVLRNGVARRAG